MKTGNRFFSIGRYQLCSESNNSWVAHKHSLKKKKYTPPQSIRFHSGWPKLSRLLCLEGSWWVAESEERPQTGKRSQAISQVDQIMCWFSRTPLETSGNATSSPYLNSWAEALEGVLIIYALKKGRMGNLESSVAYLTSVVSMWGDRQAPACWLCKYRAPSSSHPLAQVREFKKMSLITKLTLGWVSQTSLGLHPHYFHPQL